MKKKTKLLMVIILIIAILGVISPKVNADTPTLAEFAY